MRVDSSGKCKQAYLAYVASKETRGAENVNWKRHRADHCREDAPFYPPAKALDMMGERKIPALARPTEKQLENERASAKRREAAADIQYAGECIESLKPFVAKLPPKFKIIGVPEITTQRIRIFFMLRASPLAHPETMVATRWRRGGDGNTLSARTVWGTWGDAPEGP